MAYYAALASLVQLLEEMSHPNRLRNSFLGKQQISSLSQKFSLLQELLQDYSPTDKNAADCLERRIRDAAYRAQDIIESHISPQIHPEDKTHGVRRVFRHLKSAFRKALQQLRPRRFEKLTLDDVGKEYQDVENMKEEVDSIMEEMRMIKESHRALEDLQLNSYFADSTESSNQAPSSRNTMVGFDDHLTTIKGQLCGESSKLEVVSIVGMGGIGKTTLARNILDDELVVYHFYCCAWVPISQNYDLRKVLLDIGNSLKIINEESSREGNNVLAERIHKHLYGRRYFIIIDDIWDTKVLDDIKRILPDDSSGSRILLTTRQSSIADYANSFRFSHHLQLLNENQSWNLFREKVICPPELENIGRLVAKNCGGLPLAIVVVAGLLSKVNQTQYDWKEIAENVSSVAVENDEHFSKILYLSYNHLPHHLKPCFLYLGGFPENFDISVSRLIKLWVAEGFLKPIESKSLEEVAEEYLEDLVNRNLVLITKKKSNGKFKCCSLHDLLRDLCAQRASCENFLYNAKENDYLYREAIIHVPRRLSIHSYSVFHTKQIKKYFSNVRSILAFGNVWDHFLSVVSNSKLLRVLDTTNTRISFFPHEIVQLLHLRYLTLPDTILPIPPSISKLQNLQTLIVVSSTYYGTAISLPSEIWNMPHLRHVMVIRTRLPPMPHGKRITGRSPLLGRLQTLSRVVDFSFTADTIAMIPNLKKLKVLYTYKQRRPWKTFCLNNFVYLRELEVLEIGFSPQFEQLPPPTCLPKRFAFPLNLRELSLHSCMLPWKDMTVVGSLPNLRVLKLRYQAFVGEDWEPIEGEFPQLKFLQLYDLDLKYWRAEKNHFPKLEHLQIIKCTKLKEIPLEIGEITILESIEVRESKSAAASALRIREEQRDLGNNLQVHIRRRRDWS